MNNSIKVGDQVRSFDFADSVDFYVEGTVEAIDYIPNGPRDCKRYHIRPACRVADGRAVPADQVPPMVYPPLNGTPSWSGRVMNNVRKVG